MLFLKVSWTDKDQNTVSVDSMICLLMFLRGCVYFRFCSNMAFPFSAQETACGSEKRVTRKS